MKKETLETLQISDGQQLSVSLLNYGARIISVNFSNHELALSYDSMQDYLTDPFYLGATIGPITNRVANAELNIANEAFRLPANEGNNCLHSGGVGFDKNFWTPTRVTNSMVEYELEYNLATLGLRGLLKTTARYSLSKGALQIEYESQCDTTTFLNLTNHVYLNLSGHNKPIDDHDFSLFAHSLVDVNTDNIPTGNTTPIQAPFNYQLGDDSQFAEFESLIDHHFNSDYTKILSATSRSSKIKLDVLSNAPGFQFYTGTFLAQPFKPSSGFCVETQLAPDAINQPNFYSPLLLAGQLRKQITTFKFSK